MKKDASIDVKYQYWSLQQILLPGDSTMYLQIEKTVFNVPRDIGIMVKVAGDCGKRW
jgi:hypothetical protein